MQANTETARNFSLRPSLPNQLHHQASLLLRTFSCFQSIQLDPLKAIPPFPLTPIPCHTSDPHPLTLGLQGVVRPILDAPALLLKVQPLFLIQLILGSRGHQPGLMELAFGPNATINPGDLQRSGQTQFLGFNGPGDDGPVFLASAPIASLLQYRGEGPPAGVAGRF